MARCRNERRTADHRRLRGKGRTAPDRAGPGEGEGGARRSPVRRGGGGRAGRGPEPARHPGRGGGGLRRDRLHAAGLLYTLGVPLALAWSIVGLGLLEAWTGTTPGKRAMKLRVVTEAGLRIRPVAGIVRRLSLLLGPFVWLDWAPVVWGDRRRVLDHLVATKVVNAQVNDVSAR
ncbi:RDD family protein [Nonomuraea sp. NPDC052116]|uniref:RDD family protein n=1 Tax=Nonomuraea sp. NPDC052116 TaxID=3155665 RepID=UPI003441EE77